MAQLSVSWPVPLCLVGGPQHHIVPPIRLVTAAAAVSMASQVLVDCDGILEGLLDLLRQDLRLECSNVALLNAALLLEGLHWGCEAEQAAALYLRGESDP